MASRFIAIFAAFSVFAPVGASAEIALDELRGGILAQSCCGLGVNKEQGVGINAEALFKSPKFLSILGSPRPLIGGTVASDPDATSQIYAGFEWKLEASKFFIAGSLGGAIHNGETDFDPAVDLPRLSDTLFFGCRANFRLAADVGYRITKRVSASVHWAHISNANLCDENEGLDHIGARVGLSF